MLGAGRPLDHVLELLGADRRAELGEDRQAELEPPEVVVAIAVDEPRHLIAEDGVEGRPELAEEDVLLGQAAVPGVDLVETLVGGRAGAHEEHGVDGRVGGRPAERGDRRLLVGRESAVGGALGKLDDGIGLREVAVEGVGGDEVVDRVGVLDVLGEVVPARVGLQPRVERDRLVERGAKSRVLDAAVCGLAGEQTRLERGDPRRHAAGERGAEVVERRHAEIAAAGDVGRGEILRLAEEFLLEGRRDELVEFAGDLPRHPLGDRRRADLGEGPRIEEALLERIVHDGGGQAAVGVEGVDRLPQLRVAEAEGDLAVVEGDVGVDGAVVHHEQRNVGGVAACVLVDGDVLILHLVHEDPVLEHLLEVPGDLPGGVDPVAQGVGPRQAVGAVDRDLEGMGERLRRIGGLVCGDRQDDVLDLPVVVLVPDVVHRRQAEVLVDAAVSSDVVVADRAQEDLREDRAVRRQETGGSGSAGDDVDVVAHVLGGRHAAGGRTADAGEAGERIDTTGDAGERIDEHRRHPGLVEVGKHVGDQGVAGQFRLGPRGDRVEIENLARGRPGAEIADVVPGDVRPTGRDDVPAEFVEGGERVRGERDGAVGIRALVRRLESVAVEEIHARHVLAAHRIDHPLAQEVRDVVVRAVRLALVDVGRGGVDVFGIRRPDDVVRRAIQIVVARAEDVVGGAEHAVTARRLRIVDGGPRDREPGHAVGRIVERIGRVEGDVDLAAHAPGGVAPLADEVEAMVEELPEEHAPTGERRVTGEGVQVPDEVVDEIETTRLGQPVGVIAPHLRLSGENVGDLVDRMIGDGTGGSGLDPVHGGVRIDRLGDHARRRIVHRRERVGVDRGEVHVARHVVAVVGIAAAGERAEGRTPGGGGRAADVVEQPLDVTQPVRLRRAGRRGRGGRDHRRQIGRP